MFNEIHDISYLLSGKSVVFPNDPKFKLSGFTKIANQGYAMSIIQMGSHLGTHLDAPAHILEGRETIDKISLERFVGQCQVIEVHSEMVRSEDVKPYSIRPREMVLFKTKNSQLMQLDEFREDYAYITPEAAELLVNLGIKLVGLDYFTIDDIKDENFTAHKIFLGKGVPILEGIDLSGVEAGRYTLVCFPLKIANGDGSPVRAVLMR